MKLAMCICSAGRRELLRDCIASFKELAVPELWSVQIVVVDNNAEPECENTLADIRPICPFPVRCVHEPEPGISQARNRAVVTALEYDPDFVAFIDDDETIDSQWLAAMSEAHNAFTADVYQGPVYRAFPEGRSIWFEEQRTDRNQRPTGFRIKRVGTGNVMFSANLVRPKGMNLRFNNAYALTGGEDTDFFRRAREQGADMIWVRDAIVTESVPRYRQRFFYQMKRSFRNGSNETVQSLKNSASVSGYALIVWIASRDVARGIFQLIQLPIIAVFAGSRLPGKIVRAAKLISKGVGRGAGMFGLSIQSYADPRKS